MARPREFNQHEVIEGAMHLFWEKGYESSSMCDLLEATGLARGSLYKAFGSKRGIFLMALQTYLDGGLESLRQTLYEAPSAREGIEQWLIRMTQTATQDSARCGCFGVNVAAELGPHDEEVASLLQVHAQRAAQLFVRALTSDPSHPMGQPEAEDAARFIGTFIHGLQVKGRAGIVTQDQAQQMVGRVMRAIEP